MFDAMTDESGDEAGDQSGRVSGEVPGGVTDKPPIKQEITHFEAAKARLNRIGSPMSAIGRI